MTVGLGWIGRWYSFTGRIGDSEAASPGPRGRVRGRGELVEINRCGGRDLKAERTLDWEKINGECPVNSQQDTGR